MVAGHGAEGVSHSPLECPILSIVAVPAWVLWLQNVPLAIESAQAMALGEYK